MTKRICLLVSSLLFALVMPILAGTQNAQITVHVRSDDGTVATGIVVGASTFAKHIPGEGFGRDEYTIVTGTTDTNGMVTLSLQCITGEVGYGPQVPLAGFYWSRGEHVRFTNTVNGMWQPWDPTVGLQLKKIGNPIPLYARKFGEGKPIKLPELGKPVGFDLLKGDWVGPYGKGETVDFIFTLNATFGGMTKNGYQIHDSVFTVGFPKEGDGIQSVYAQPFAGSVLRLPRYAPEQGYQTNLFRQMYRHEDGGSAECREDQNYFFRVRTEKDEKGNIVRALYGKIHGEIGCWQNGVIRFSYYLNPTPNERNLEFDPSRNLFTDLKSTERMTDP